ADTEAGAVLDEAEDRLAEAIHDSAQERGSASGPGEGAADSDPSSGAVDGGRDSGDQPRPRRS
ncbi:AI-2E family transporter, partial [Burkholderia multivorans]